MKEMVKRKISTDSRVVLLSALFLAVILSGCGSSGQQAEVSRPPGAVSTAQVSTPAEIRLLELEDQGETTSIRLTADRQLVWTNYRDNEGNLVVELPNTVVSSAIQDMTPASGLVSGVEVERMDDAERPLIRLVVKTRDESEHALSTEGRILQLQLTPVGYIPMAEEEPVALAYEPLPEEETLELAVEEASAAAPPSAGTPEQPYVSPPPRGTAATRLDSVEVLARGSDATVVRIVGDGEFSFSTFRLENPERFVIDLDGVVNSSANSNLPVGSDKVDQIRVGQFKPRPEPVSRVVFDLGTPVTPQIDRSPDGLVVRFGESSGTLIEDVLATETVDPEPMAAPPEPAPEAIAETLPAETPPVEPVEPVIVEAQVVEEPIETETLEEPVMADSSPPAQEVPTWSPPEPASEPEVRIAEASPTPEPPTIERGDQGSIPVFEPPPARQQRPAPTSDVELIEAQQVQVQQPPQTEQQVFPQFEALVVNRRQREYVGQPISMSLKDADLVETLRSFSRFTDLNFVIQPGVSGSVTVELTGVPWDQALEQILKINNLGMDIDGTIVRIAPLAQLRAEAEEERQLAASRQQAIPLRTIMKSLSYATAGEVAALLRNRTGSILSSRGTVQVDARTNTLILRELPTNIDTVLAVIENLDTPEPQVTIEARIIEATKQFSRSLGISWAFNGVASQEFGNTTGLQFPNNIQSDGGVELLTGGANGFLNLSLGNVLDTFTLDATIQAAENEGLVNVISAPRVTTLNNESASIQSGLQIPIQTVSNRTVSVQFVNATLQLQVVPHVTAEGTIMMDINVSKKEPQLAFAIVGATNAPIATKEAQTKVVVRDGGTAVIGGIYEVTSNQNQDRVPGLANIPIIGHLFKNRSRDDSNDELMIFITPRIVQM